MSTQPRFDGSRARRLRIETGLTVRQIATAVGRAPNTVRAYETRNVVPAPPVRAALERLYGVQPGDLLIYAETAAS